MKSNGSSPYAVVIGDKYLRSLVKMRLPVLSNVGMQLGAGTALASAMLDQEVEEFPPVDCMLNLGRWFCSICYA